MNLRLPLAAAFLIVGAYSNGASPADFRPTAESINKIIRANHSIMNGRLEGTGVTPEIPVNADHALNVALGL